MERAEMKLRLDAVVIQQGNKNVTTCSVLCGVVWCVVWYDAVCGVVWCGAVCGAM